MGVIDLHHARVRVRLGAHVFDRSWLWCGGGHRGWFGSGRRFNDRGRFNGGGGSADREVGSNKGRRGVYCGSGFDGERGLGGRSGSDDGRGFGGRGGLDYGRGLDVGRGLGFGSSMG